LGLSRVGKKAFRAAAKELALPEITWRSFRRSVETLLHTEGVPMKIQQQILGHTKASTTLLYAEPGMAERRQALGKIQSQLLPNVAKLQLELQLSTGKLFKRWGERRDSNPRRPDPQSGALPS
jgi:integrase